MAKRKTSSPADVLAICAKPKKAMKADAVRAGIKRLRLSDMTQLTLNPKIDKKLPAIKSKMTVEGRVTDALESFLINPDSHMILVDERNTLPELSSFIDNWLKQHPKNAEVYKNNLRDYVYVNNFEQKNSPVLLELPAGMGTQFRKDMEKVAEDLVILGPRWIEIVDKHPLSLKIINDVAIKRTAILKKIENVCAENGIILDQDAARGGGSFEAISRPAPGYEDRYEEIVRAIFPKIEALFHQLRELVIDMMNRLKFEKENLATTEISNIFCGIMKTYGEYSRVEEFIDSCIEYSLKMLLTKKLEESKADGMQGMMGMTNNPKDSVNILIPNVIRTSTEIPIVHEKAVGVNQLIGTEKKVVRYGMMESSLENLIPGIFHRVNGGILLVNVVDLLTYPYAWDVFVKTMKAGQIQIESLGAWMGVDQFGGMQPDPIPINVKVLLYFPEMWLYDRISYGDPEFSEVFSDSYLTISRNRFFIGTGNKTTDKKNLNSLINYIRYISQDAGLTLSPAGLKEVVRYMAHLSDSKKVIELDVRVEGHLRRLFKDLVNYGKRPKVDDIRKTILRFKKGTDALERNISERFLDIFLMELGGEEVGVTTGLAVVGHNEDVLGCYPMRLTAVTSFGKGLKFLDNEAGFAYESMQKSCHIIIQWMKSTFGQKLPLLCEIGISIEQNHSDIDGDSATCACIAAIISALTGIPNKRKYAMTGSMDQLGNVQPIGGLNTKIRGMWLLARQKGVKEINVIFPKKNMQDLIVIDPEMEADIRKGRLNLFPVERIEQVLSLVMEKPTADIYAGVMTKLVEYLQVSKDVHSFLNNGKELAEESSEESE